MCPGDRVRILTGPLAGQVRVIRLIAGNAIFLVSYDWYVTTQQIELVEGPPDTRKLFAS